MKTYLDAENAEVRIEILPLIDVIFCILTFFILGAVGLTRPEGIEMDLPEASTSKPVLSQTMEVRLDVIGQLFLKEQPVSREQLRQSLVSYIRAQPRGVVVLNADRAASYDDVIQVLDFLQSIGGNRVALGTTEPPPSEQSPGQAPGTLPPPPGTPPGAAPGQLPPLPGQNNQLSPAPPTPGSSVPTLQPRPVQPIPPSQQGGAPSGTPPTDSSSLSPDDLAP